jgi:hypothetical protein
MNDLKESIFKLTKCCVSTRPHIVNDPMCLPCAGNCCRKCLEEMTHDEFQCNFCDIIHPKEVLKNVNSNPTINFIMNAWSSDIIKEFREKFDFLAKQFEGKILIHTIYKRQMFISLNCKENLSDDKINKYFQELNHQVDSFARQFKVLVDVLKDDLKNKLSDAFNKMKK